MPGIICPTGTYSRIRRPRFFQRRLKLIGHAVELLHFQGRLRQTVFFQQSQAVGDGADIVRSGGQLYAALTGAAGHGLNKHFGHAFETGVGFMFGGPYGHGPDHFLGVDDFVIPICAFDEPDGDLPTRALGPRDYPFGVIHRAAEISLHGQTGGKIDCFAALLEQGEREVLEAHIVPCRNL